MKRQKRAQGPDPDTEDHRSQAPVPLADVVVQVGKRPKKLTPEEQKAMSNVKAGILENLINSHGMLENSTLLDLLWTEHLDQNPTLVSEDFKKAFKKEVRPTNPFLEQIQINSM
jgi:hypothetical protein